MQPHLGVLFLAACTLVADGRAPAQTRIDFVEQIQPILKARCYECHGAEEPEADLRLDVRTVVLGDDATEGLLVPGKPDDSEIYFRITLPADDPDIMPNEGDPLSAAEIALFEQWISEGADWPVAADAAAAVPRSMPVIELPELSAAERTARDEALRALRGRSVLARPIAAATAAAEVNLGVLGAAAGDDLVELLAGLEPSLVWLDAARTAVSDASLATIGKCHQLRRLNLARTAVSDAGLKRLVGLQRLAVLNLYGTAVSDAGLESLAAMPALRKVYLWQTKVTEAGAGHLREQRPELAIDLGRYADVLGEVAKMQAPVNEKCPLTGKPVDPAYTFRFDDRTVGFCCGKCRSQVAADPAEFAVKLRTAK